MADAIPDRVRAECRTFCRHLVGVEPDEAVVHAYWRGLGSSAFLDGPRIDRLDRAMLGIARTSRLAAGITDAWCRFAAPAGAVRRRLVLLAAILESIAPFSEAFEPEPDGPVSSWIGLFVTGFGFLFRLAIAVPVCGPVHAWCAVVGGIAGPGGQS